MADDTEDRRVVEPLALARLRRRYAGADGDAIGEMLAAARTAEEGECMGTSEIIERLIEAIRKAEEHGLTQYQLAELTGVPRSTLTRLLKRERESLKVETVEKLCHALGMTLEIKPRGRRARKADK